MAMSAVRFVATSVGALDDPTALHGPHAFKSSSPWSIDFSREIFTAERCWGEGFGFCARCSSTRLVEYIEAPTKSLASLNLATSNFSLPVVADSEVLLLVRLLLSQGSPREASTITRDGDVTGKTGNVRGCGLEVTPVNRIGVVEKRSLLILPGVVRS
jgi:hypothetical protein